MNNADETIRLILDRNARVEAEKAWEQSVTRRLFLAVLIYLTAALLLWLTTQPEFLLLSLIPALGYLFSTLSLPWVKRRWIKRQAANGDL